MHQRCMGGMAETLCSIILHTDIDKAIIPACSSDGFLYLGQASSLLNIDLKSQGPARVFFDARLSTDSFMPGAHSALAMRSRAYVYIATYR